MTNKFIKLSTTLILLITCGCKSSESSAGDLERIEAAQNFVNAVNSFQNKENWNIPFRVALIKADCPIAYTTAVHVNFNGNNIIYDDNQIILTVSMIIEETIFKKKKYNLRAWIGETRSYKELHSYDQKILSKIEGTKLSNCELYFKISLKDFKEIVFYGIHDGKNTDHLMHTLAVKHVLKTFDYLYKTSIKKGKKAEGVLTHHIRF